MTDGGDRRGVRSLLDRVADRIVADPRDIDGRMKAKVLVIFAAIILMMSLTWGFSLLGYHQWWLFVAFMLGAVVIVLAVVQAILHRTLLASSRVIVALALLGTVAGTYLTGGLRLTNISPFFMVVIAPIFLLGKGGLIYASSGFAVALLFQAAHWAGHTFPDVVPPSGQPLDAFLSWVLSLTVVALFVIFYERSRRISIQRLDEASRAKTRFLASISHELRTPLHVIMGMSRILESDNLSDKQVGYLQTVQQSSDQLLDQVNDLLDVSAIEDGKLKLETVDFDPVEVAREVVESTRIRAADKPLSVELVTDTDVPSLVRGDPRRLRQVLMNLVVNAVKFTDEGFVELRLSKADLGSKLACTFRITDTGIGIDESNVSGIFHRFSRLPDTHDSREGAGLGLFITRELVQRMGGAIDVQSAPGRGSTFSVRVDFSEPGPAH